MSTEINELKNCKEKGLCCGAGGAQIFKESESGNKEVNIKRTEEIVESNSDIVAVGCPFCKLMISDGIKNVKSKKELVVYDIAELLDKAT